MTIDDKPYKHLRLEKEKSQQETLNKSEEISALKTYVMSNMSHELRTPINVIMGIAESELENLKDNSLKTPYEIIKNASLRLLSNVSDIIDFEKIENKQLELSPETFNPSIKLEQISNNWQIEANKKGLDYKFEMNSEIPYNVLSNAVKYTDKGSVLF